MTQTSRAECEPASHETAQDTRRDPRAGTPPSDAHRIQPRRCQIELPIESFKCGWVGHASVIVHLIASRCKVQSLDQVLQELLPCSGSKLTNQMSNHSEDGWHEDTVPLDCRSLPPEGTVPLDCRFLLPKGTVLLDCRIQPSKGTVPLDCRFLLPRGVQQAHQRDRHQQRGPNRHAEGKLHAHRGSSI